MNILSTFTFVMDQLHIHDIKDLIEKEDIFIKKLINDNFTKSSNKMNISFTPYIQSTDVGIDDTHKLIIHNIPLYIYEHYGQFNTSEDFSTFLTDTIIIFNTKDNIDPLILKAIQTFLERLPDIIKEEGFWFGVTEDKLQEDYEKIMDFYLGKLSSVDSTITFVEDNIIRMITDLNVSDFSNIFLGDKLHVYPLIEIIEL